MLCRLEWFFIKHLQNIMIRVEEFISNVIKERGNRLVIFIDELDRCRPDYIAESEDNEDRRKRLEVE